MKSLARIFGLAFFVYYAAVVVAQQPITQPVDPNAPLLTVDEKITLMTDDVKMADLLYKAQKAFIAAQKPLKDHQDAAKAVIENEHPGWVLENGPQGWHFAKKPVEQPKAQEKK